MELVHEIIFGDEHEIQLLQIEHEQKLIDNDHVQNDIIYLVHTIGVV